jgi:hypothetical protein
MPCLKILAARSACLATSLIVVACGGGDDDGASANTGFGERELSNLDEACEGVTGLTGQAILDKKVDAFSSILAYVTATGDRVDPTNLDVQLTWPASPVATCYPEYETSGPRVAIEGLVMKFNTADGKFDESMAAKAWLPVVGGAVQFPQAQAVTTRGKLHGSWQPFPEYAVTAATTMGFFSRLEGPATANAGGNVGASATSVAKLDAGIFQGGFAMAQWPAPPP